VTWTFRAITPCPHCGQSHKGTSRAVVESADLPPGKDTFYYARFRAAQMLGCPVEALIWEEA
jgi:hypothetical protein